MSMKTTMNAIQTRTRSVKRGRNQILAVAVTGAGSAYEAALHAADVAAVRRYDLDSEHLRQVNRSAEDGAQTWLFEYRQNRGW